MIEVEVAVEVEVEVEVEEKYFSLIRRMVDVFPVSTNDKHCY